MDQEATLLYNHLTKIQTTRTAQINITITKRFGFLYEVNVMCNIIPYQFLFHFRDHVTRNAVFVYSIYSFGVIAFDEIYSLWSATPRYYGECLFLVTSSVVTVVF